MQPLKVKDVKPSDLDGLSKDQIDQHWEHYEKYVEQVNHLIQIETSLKADKGNSVINNYRIDLAKQLSFERNGVFLHECYFANLTSGTMYNSDGKFAELIANSFSSFDDYLEDFRLISQARGENWIVTTFDIELDCVRNVVIDLHDGWVESCL